MKRTEATKTSGIISTGNLTQEIFTPGNQTVASGSQNFEEDRPESQTSSQRDFGDRPRSIKQGILEQLASRDRGTPSSENRNSSRKSTQSVQESLLKMVPKDSVSPLKKSQSEQTSYPKNSQEMQLKQDEILIDNTITLFQNSDSQKSIDLPTSQSLSKRDKDSIYNSESQSKLNDESFNISKSDSRPIKDLIQESQTSKGDQEAGHEQVKVSLSPSRGSASDVSEDENRNSETNESKQNLVCIEDESVEIEEISIEPAHNPLAYKRQIVAVRGGKDLGLPGRSYEPVLNIRGRKTPESSETKEGIVRVKGSPIGTNKTPEYETKEKLLIEELKSKNSSNTTKGQETENSPTKIEGNLVNNSATENEIITTDGFLSKIDSPIFNTDQQISSKSSTQSNKNSSKHTSLVHSPISPYYSPVSEILDSLESKSISNSELKSQSSKGQIDTYIADASPSQIQDNILIEDQLESEARLVKSETAKFANQEEVVPFEQKLAEQYSKETLEMLHFKNPNLDGRQFRQPSFGPGQEDFIDSSSMNVERASSPSLSLESGGKRHKPSFNAFDSITEEHIKFENEFESEIEDKNSQAKNITPNAHLQSCCSCHNGVNENKMMEIFALLSDEKVIKGLRLIGGFAQFIEERGHEFLNIPR